MAKAPTFSIHWENRPCFVNGRKALWHTWSYDEKLYLKYDVLLRADRINQIQKIFEDKKICGPEAHIEKVSHLFGLVEYENGDIEKVEPTDIKFIDSNEKFREICWEV